MTLSTRPNCRLNSARRPSQQKYGSPRQRKSPPRPRRREPFNPAKPGNPDPIPARADFGPLRLASEGGPKPKLPWIDLAFRINQEMNDRKAGSRSGDIVLLMNTETGHIAVNEPDILPGWHGGPTKAEAEVPMIWRFGPAAGPTPARRSDLLDIVAQKLNAMKGAGPLRTLHFKQALLNVLSAVKATKVQQP